MFKKQKTFTGIYIFIDPHGLNFQFSEPKSLNVQDV